MACCGRSDYQTHDQRQGPPQRPQILNFPNSRSHSWSRSLEFGRDGHRRRKANKRWRNRNTRTADSSKAENDEHTTRLLMTRMKLHAGAPNCEILEWHCIRLLPPNQVKSKHLTARTQAFVQLWRPCLCKRRIDGIGVTCLRIVGWRKWLIRGQPSGWRQGDTLVCQAQLLRSLDLKKS